MKSIFNISRHAAIPAAVAAILLTNLLTACGQTGPLFLPAKPASANAPAKAAAPLPAAAGDSLSVPK